MKNYKQKIINFSTSYRSKHMSEDNNNDNSKKMMSSFLNKGKKK